LERIAEIQRAAIPTRLHAGAEVLGRLWKAGQRCLALWGLHCPCGPKATQFCEAKRKWIGLALEYYSGDPFGLKPDNPYYVIEAVTVSQFKAIGLTASVQLPGAARPIKVGPKGTDWGTIADLASIRDLSECGDALTAVLALQQAGL
jgi:hypothetical protein